MPRYPKPARQAAIKCITCNAPVVETVSDTYTCVECGRTPVSPKAVSSSAESD